MTSGRDAAASPDIRSYGRRRGRRLSPRQAGLVANVLPRLAIDISMPAPVPLTSLFGGQISDVWLEIGFGGGEHLVWQAEHHERVGLIGCEPFLDGVVKAVSAIEARALSNIRLYADDARRLLRWLPESSIGRAFILFPDPWPKRRHAKRRLIAPGTLAMLACVMRAGAELRIATDIEAYASAALLAFRITPEFSWQVRGPGDWRDRPADWPATRYETKALQQGRRCYYLSFRRA